MIRKIFIAIVAVAVVGCSKDEPKDTENTKPGDKPSAEESKAKPAAKATPKADREFDFESAKITFAYKGKIEGTVIAWVADYGGTVVLQRDMTKPMPHKQTIIWKDGKNTMWDHTGDNKRVQITRLRSKETELRLISTKDPKQLKYAGYVAKPSEKVAGQDCEVFHTDKQNVTIWRWGGVDLKAVNGAVKSAQYSHEATEVKLGVTIPPEVMTPPADYEVLDMAK